SGFTWNSTRTAIWLMASFLLPPDFTSAYGVAQPVPCCNAGQKPGVAGIERHGRERPPVERRLRVRVAENLEAELVPEPDRHGHAGTEIAAGVVDPVMLAD